MFVMLPGRTREEAMLIGQSMADHVTSLNKPPIRLQFEKVFHPCVMMSKKRYVGMAYEAVGGGGGKKKEEKQKERKEGEEENESRSKRGKSGESVKEVEEGREERET